MKYTAAAAAVLLTVGANAATNSSLIPSDISSTCSTFLTKLDTDTSLQSCINPLISATAQFSPSASGAPSSSAVDAAIKTVCTSSGCDDSTMRQWLSDFYAACPTELKSSNAKVLELYDVLYVVQPLKAAICAVDSSTQKYCVKTIASASKTTAVAGSSNLAVGVSDAQSAIKTAQAYLTSFATSLRRRYTGLIERATTADLATILYPNATTYQGTNLPFLFLQATMSNATLCTPCTREVFVSYMKWESKTTYSIGLSNSPILGGQSALYAAVGKTCGSAFTAAIEAEAGVSASSVSAAGRQALPAFAAVAAGIVAVAFVL